MAVGANFSTVPSADHLAYLSRSEPIAEVVTQN